MKNKHMLMAVALILLLSPKILSQEETHSVVTVETYEKVLTLIFPRDEMNALGSGWGFVTILRYMPSFEPESQIVIVGREEKTRVTEYKSLERNIYSKLNELYARTGRNDPAELAKLIPVSKREFYVPNTQGVRWRRNLIERVSLALKAKKFEFAPRSLMVREDGTNYELWDTSVSGDVHYSPTGNTVRYRRYPGKAALEYWMKLVQREVRNHK